MREAIELLHVARELAEGPQFSDVDRADVLFRLGVCRYKLSSIATAVALFDEALALAERSGLPCDLLRADILGWRSRCRRRQRDFEAAREDVERALELAAAWTTGGRSRTPTSRRRSSPSGWATGSASRNYAQQARAIYQELNDERNVGRLMLNLGGLQLLLGKPEQAIEHLKASFALAVEAESQPDAAQALGKPGDGVPAPRRLRRGRRARTQGARPPRGARGLPRRDRPVAPRAGPLAARAGPTRRGGGVLPGGGPGVRAHGVGGTRAGAWVALGDLAERRGDDREAARLYRNAAEALQDIRF